SFAMSTVYLPSARPAIVTVWRPCWHRCHEPSVLTEYATPPSEPVGSDELNVQVKGPAPEFAYVAGAELKLAAEAPAALIATTNTVQAAHTARARIAPR